MSEQRKVAIVAGAIRGIGLGIAASLASKGVNTLLLYYDWLEQLPEMQAVMEESCSKSGAQYHAISADLRNRKDAEMVADKAISLWNRADILINNIERGGWPIVHGPYTPEQWDLEFQTTVTAKWNLFNALLPHLKRGGSGSVINISSIAAEVGRAGPAAPVFNDCYSLSNRAIRSLTRQWAREAAPEVRVNELMLGFFETRHGPGTRGWSLLSPQEQQAIIDHTLLGRTGVIEEIIDAVNFLVFNAGFITGTSILIDGGYLIGGEKAEEMPEGVVKPGEPTFGGKIPPAGKR